MIIISINLLEKFHHDNFFNFFGHIIQPYFLVLCPIWTVGSMHVATFYWEVWGGQVVGWSVCVCVCGGGFSHGCFWAWSAFSAVPGPGSVNRVVDVQIAQGKCLFRTQRASLKICHAHLTLFGPDLLVPVCFTELQWGQKFCKVGVHTVHLGVEVTALLTSLESHFSPTLWDQRSFDFRRCVLNDLGRFGFLRCHGHVHNEAKPRAVQLEISGSRSGPSERWICMKIPQLD